jgi:hypothetical protein
MAVIEPFARVVFNEIERGRHRGSQQVRICKLTVRLPAMTVHVEDVEFFAQGRDMPTHPIAHPGMLRRRIANIGIPIEAVKILAEDGDIGLIEIVDEREKLSIDGLGCVIG